VVLPAHRGFGLGVKQNGSAEKVIIRGALPEHIKNLGGHQAPVSAATARDSGPSKRTRDDKTGPVRKAEQEEQERREAARRRVQARTAAAFGL
jgi:hypothetical protein